MPYAIRLPDGTLVENIPDELPPEQAKQRIISAGLLKAPAALQAPQSTITGELLRGGKQLVSSVRTGLESILSPEEAAVAGVERGQKIAQETGEGPSLEAVRKAYEERGLLPAAGEVVSQIPRALAGQGAQIAAMAGGARLGATAGAAVSPFLGPAAPLGPLVGGALGAGATLLPQFMGANVERQAREQMERGEPVSIDRTAAYGSAAGQAALEGAGTAFVFGKRLVKGVLGIADDAALASAKAQEELAKAAARSLAARAGLGAVRGTAEIPVEIAQAVLERAQAGLDLTSPEALSEYGENAYLAGLIGPTIGGVTGAMDRGKAPPPLEGQLPGETVEQSITRLQREILADTQQPPPPPPAPDLVGLAAQPEGYGVLEQLKQQLLQADQTPEVKQQLADIGDLQTRMNVEAVGRMTPKAASLEEALAGEPITPPVLSMDDMVDVMRQGPNGWAQLFQYKNQLLNFATQQNQKKQLVEPAVFEAMQNAQFLMDRATQEEYQRRPSGKQYESAFTPPPPPPPPVTQVDDKVARGLGFVPSKSGKGIYNQIIDKDLTDPAQLKEVRSALETYVIKGNGAESTIARVSSFLKSIPQGEADVGKPVTPPSGAGAPVAVEPSAGAAPAGVGITEPSGVVPAVEDVGIPDGGTEGKPAAIEQAAPATPVALPPQAQQAPRSGLPDTEVGGAPATKQSLRTAIQDARAEVEASLQDWSSRKYLPNQKQVELTGDGPRAVPSISVGEINAKRKQRTIESLTIERNALNKLERQISDEASLNDFVQKAQNIYRQAEEDFAQDTTGQIKSAGDLFEYRILDALNIRPPSGAYSSNRVSQTIRSVIEAQPKAAPVEAEAAPAGPSISDEELLGLFAPALEGTKPKKSLAAVPPTAWGELERRAKAAREAEPEATPEEKPTQQLKPETQQKIKQLQGLLKTLMNRFGLKDVGLNLVADLEANGEYANNLIKLALDAVSPVRDLRHESLHALKELGFFTPQQWAVLEKKAKDTWINQFLKQRNVNGFALQEGEKSRYDAYVEMFTADQMSPDAMQEALIEEAISDAFGEFDVNKAPAGLMQAILKRMKTFFAVIKEALGQARIESAEDIFERIEKGELKPVNVPQVNGQYQRLSLALPEDYRGEHKAPNKDSGSPGHDLSGVYPDDVYGPNGPRYYAHYGDAKDNESFDIVKRIRNKPNVPLTIYRAVPKSAPSVINEGDWVTISRDYAKLHGEGPLQGDYKIVKKLARPRDIFTNGDSIHEWGYYPQPMVSSEEAKTKGYKYSLRGEVPLSTRSIMESNDDFARANLGLNIKPVRGIANKVRDIAIALNAQTQGEQGVMDRQALSMENEKAIANAIADEVAYQLTAGKRATGSGLGWYSTNYPNAVKRLGKRFPELETNPHARSVFSALVAVTSNGEKVTKNISNATELYSKLRAGKPLVAMGNRRATALENNLQVIQDLLAKHGTDFEKVLLQEITVKDMNAQLRAMGLKSDGSYLANTRVPAAAVYFGPKLGAFYANLSGSEGYLTMDLWWTRSINRMRGLLLPKATEASINKMRDMIGDPSLSRDDVVAATVPLRNKYEEYGFTTELEHLVGKKEPAKKEGKPAWDAKAKRVAGAAYEQLLYDHNLEKMANTIYKNEFEGIEEAPFTATDRAFMYRAGRRAQALLRGEGIDLTLADIQAALWYYEKRLYEKLSGKKADDIGYEEAIIAQADQADRREGPSVVFPERVGGRDVTAGKVTGAPEVRGESTEAKPEGLKKSSLRNTNTKEFKQWFGNSQIVDEDGQPLVMYHGSARDITTFRGKQAGAIFLTEDPGFAEVFSEDSLSWMARHADQFLNEDQVQQGKARAAKVFKDTMKGASTSAKAMLQDAINYVNGKNLNPSKDVVDYVNEELVNQFKSLMPTGPMIYPVYVKAEKPFDYENSDHIAALTKTEDGDLLYPEELEQIKKGRWDLIEKPHVQRAIRQAGFDGFYVMEQSGKNLAVYSSDQIKSATGNVGAYGQRPITAEEAGRAGMTEEEAAEAQKRGDIRFSLRDKLGMYSELENKIAQGSNKAPAASWKAYVNGLTQKGVKPEEIEWSGVRDWLDLQKGTVTKDDLLNYLKQGGVKVEETVLGGKENWTQEDSERLDDLEARRDDLTPEEEQERTNLIRRENDATEEGYSSPQNLTKYGQYTLPGGENYREVLLTLPTKKLSVEEARKVLKAKPDAKLSDADITYASNKAAQQYRSSHWDQPNVLAHIRLNDRTDADGKKVLFVEEIQSDWGQEGKKKGFKLTEEKRAALEKQLTDLELQKNRVRREGFRVPRDGERIEDADPNFLKYQELQREYDAVEKQLEDRILAPIAPFVTKTEGWLNLALKRIMVMAAEGGYDKVAFITGEQSHNRFPKKASGESTKESFKAFYDQIVPMAAKKLLPKVRGGQMEEVNLLKDSMRKFDRALMKDDFKRLGEEGFRAKYAHDEQPGFDVTPDMKQKVETTGLPRFSIRDKKSVRNNLSPATLAAVDKVTTARYEPGFVERITKAIAPEAFSKLRAQALNRYNQLGVYDKLKAKQMGGVELLADQSAEAAALMSDLGAGVTAQAMGVHDRVGGIPVYRKGYTTVSNEGGTVKGIIAIFAPLAKYGDPEVYRDFQFWAGSKRGSRFLADGTEKLYTPANMRQAQEILKVYPEFETIFKEWTKYNEGLVKYMVDTGVISEANGKKFIQHSDYIPFYRQIDGETTVGPNIFQSIAGVKAPKKIKGGEEPLADFLETIVRNTQASIQAGLKNVAAQRAVKLAEDIGEATRLPNEQSGVNIVTVLENGKKVSYACNDPLFINAVKSLNLPDLPFIGLLAGPANLLRNLVTKDPGFMLANMMRDSMSAMVTSGVNMTPIVSTIKNFGDAIAVKSPEYDALLKAGVLGGYDYSAGVEASAQQLAKELRKEAKVSTAAEKALRPATWLWEALEKGTQASDAATRIEVYKKTLEATGNEAEALFRALEVMNFNRKGSSAVIRIATAAIPFLNARMQGLDVLYRAAISPSLDVNATERAKQIQKTFFVRGMTIAALSCMYWMMTHDEDEYKKQEQETRDNYWLFPNLGIKIPIPFEIGIIFKVIPERIMAYTFGDDTGKDFMKSMKRNFENTLPITPMGMIPQLAKPYAEVTMNYSLFTGRPIIGQGMETVDPKYQSLPMTATFLKDLGEKLNISPIKMEYLIRGYTGTIGSYMVDAIDSIYNMNVDAPRASKRFEQMPVLKRFALDSEARGTVTAYYDLKNAVDTVVRTSNYLERTQNYEAYAKYLEDNMEILAAKDYVLDMYKTLSDFNEYKQMIRGSEMSADEKRDALLQITEVENQLTANIQMFRKMAKQ